jgi:hypothetical protein
MALTCFFGRLSVIIVCVLFIKYPITVIHTPPLFILLWYKLEDAMQVAL